MVSKYTYKPFVYYFLTFLVTWISWFSAAYFSYEPGQEKFYILLMIPGLVAPFVIALCLIVLSNNRALFKDFINRLFNLYLIRPYSLIIAFLIMPLSVLISITFSLLIGESSDQFKFAHEFSFTAAFVPILLVLALAAIFEELGWRGYGVDSLNKFTYFTATALFAVLWALWHLPLFFINNYYQNQLLKTNIWFAVNFMVSMFPIAFIISWFCKANRGSILIAIIFHFFINITQETFQISQITKCIQTAVLSFIALIIVLQNKKLFFT